MQIPRFRKTYRNIKRYRQILSVLLKYGFDDIVERLKLRSFLKIGRRFFRKSRAVQKIEHLTTAQRLRMALAELGPTFIKLGQVLSTRPDLIPLDFVKELEKLQDNVPPFPSHQAMQIVATELNKPVAELFLSFSEEPLAAASIAQVHRAVFPDGKAIVVKIQRPNIRTTIETDINILYDFAAIVEKYIPEAELYNPKAIVNEFAKTIRSELDFIREGRNIDRFRNYFKNDRTIYLPQVYWEYTTANVLTMEFIDGTKISDIDFSQRSDLNPKIIARNGAMATLKMIFEYGFFHADPHPGNIFVLKNNILAPIDFGMVGRLDEQTKNYLRSLLSAIVEKDIDRIIKIFIDAEVLDERNDTRSLRLDLNDFIDTYMGIPLYQLEIEKLFGDLVDVLRRHRISLMTDVVLMAKALATIEALGRSLDPEFNIMTLIEPYATKLMLQPVLPMKQLKELKQLAKDTEELIKILPSDLKFILRKMKKGKMNMIFEHRGLERLILEIDKSSNRLSFSLIIAALIIGSSLIIFLNKGPFILGLSIFGLIGFLIAAILGLWLVIAILRSGKL
ncbi:AarF/ABC1/UbiB kinase family protein [candidate division KSB1 bacterium]|nr:AarF/ABC1/UbiB kinase family protein [candidate division KSB1 bacterium]